MKVEHELTTVGPGIPACTCGEVFEWKYEHDSHKIRWAVYDQETRNA